MKLEGMIWCSGPGCEAHQHVGADTMEAERLPVGWLKVIEYGNGHTDPACAYCGWDCLLKAAGEVPPPIVVE